MRAWLRLYGRDTFRSWDFYVAVAVGVVAFGAAWDRGVRDAAVPVLLAEGAIGVGLTATVFAALAVFATFYDAGYRRVLELGGGFSSALMPYITVGVVSALAGGLGIVGALVLPALGHLPIACVCGAATLMFTWSVTGMVSLTALTWFHATERAKLMSGADEAATIRAKRLRKSPT